MSVIMKLRSHMTRWLVSIGLGQAWAPLCMFSIRRSHLVFYSPVFFFSPICFRLLSFCDVSIHQAAEEEEGLRGRCWVPSEASSKNGSPNSRWVSLSLFLSLILALSLSLCPSLLWLTISLSGGHRWRVPILCPERWHMVISMSQQ